MKKYELAVVVSAMIEDDARTAVVDKCKALVERFGGKIADVEEWGKKKLAYEIQKMTEGYYYFIHFEAEGDQNSEIESRMRIESWTASSDTYALDRTKHKENTI